MYVRYANGDFKNAVRPETAQIERTVNMDKFNGKTVYMGFTSAVGSSKANHTIHSFQFTNEFKPIDGKASYKVEYYLQDENAPDNYILQDRDTVTEDNATAEDVVNDTDNGYKKTYEGYDYTTVDGKSISRITVAADGSSVLRLYYNLKDKATYRLNYWLKNKTTGEYEKKGSSSVKEGYVGDSVTASDVDGTYPTKYVDSNYALSSVKPQNDKATLAQKDTLYEMDVYYDPEEAGYKLNYYKLNPDTGEYEYVESTDVKPGTVGTTYTVTDADADYESKYTSDGYTLNKDKNESYSVKIEQADKTYEMKAYYVPPMTKYKTEYYLEQPDGSFAKKDESTTDNVYAGKTVTAEEKKYDGYTHVTVTESNETDVVKEDSSTILKVYYKLNEETTTQTLTTQQPTTTAPAKQVKTGDTSSNSLFVMLMSAMAVACGCFFGRKKTKEQE